MMVRKFLPIFYLLYVDCIAYILEEKKQENIGQEFQNKLEIRKKIRR